MLIYHLESQPIFFGFQQIQEVECHNQRIWSSWWFQTLWKTFAKFYGDFKEVRMIYEIF